MGQGHYQAIVFGAIAPPTEAIDDKGYTDRTKWYDDAEGAAEKRRRVRFLSSYEATPFYRGVVIAVSDAFLAKEWGVQRIARRVIPADGLLDWITAHVLPIHDRAIAAWEDIRTAGREAGVEVPEGQLLVVWDWD